MEDKEILEMGIADTIIEKPIGFIVDEQHFYIYPVTLGKTYILARLLKSLETNEKGWSVIHIWKHYVCVPGRKMLSAAF